jgi:hypothetical protein
MREDKSQGFCICMECNERKAHVKGHPCREEKCPVCGKRMLREGGYHHQLLRKKRSME